MSEDRPDEDRGLDKKKQPKEGEKKPAASGARSGRARRRTIGDNPMGLH